MSFNYGSEKLKYFNPENPVNKKEMAENPLWFIHLNEIITETPIHRISDRAAKLARSGIMLDDINQYVYHENGEKFRYINVLRRGVKIMTENHFKREMLGVRELNPHLSEKAFKKLCLLVLHEYRLCPLGGMLDRAGKYSLVGQVSNSSFMEKLYLKTYKWDFQTITEIFSRAMYLDRFDVVDDSEEPREGETFLCYFVLGDIDPKKMAFKWMMGQMNKFRSSNSMEDIYEAVISIHDRGELITHSAIAIEMDKDKRAITNFISRHDEEDVIKEEIKRLNEETKHSAVMRKIGEFMGQHGRMPSRNELDTLLKPPRPHRTELSSIIKEAKNNFELLDLEQDIGGS